MRPIRRKLDRAAKLVACLRDTALAEGPGYRAIPRQRNGSAVTG